MNFTKNSNKQKENNNINNQKKEKCDKSKKKNGKDKKEKNSKSKAPKNQNKKKYTKKSLPSWKKLEFPISQISGKIEKNYKKRIFPKNLNKEDIDIILNVIYKKSKKFSPVKANTRLTFFFIFFSLSSFVFGLIFLIEKKILIGIILIFISLFLFFIYMHTIRKSINNKYKKCHQDLFYFTDNINRKYLAGLGYYLLIDYNFKFIGIYTIPNYIKEILEFRDYNIELKKTLRGQTINHLYKKENNNKINKTSSNINYSFYNNNFKNIFNANRNYYTFGYNYNNINYSNLINNNINNINDSINTYEEEEEKNNSNIKNKVKFNNFFRTENKFKDNNIKNEDIIIDIPLNRKYNFNNRRFIKNSIDNLNERMTKKDNNNNNSQINNRSTDKFKDFMESNHNGLGIINKITN